MNVKEIEDHKFDDLVVELEKEIENLEKQKAAAKLKLEVLEAKEIAEPGDDEKILNLKAELELLSGLVVEREEKIKALNDEVKRREDIKLKIQELIDSVDFEEEETHKRWDREAEAEVEYKVKLVERFLHNLKFCDHIKFLEEVEDREGKIIEVEKEREVFWNKKLILKHLKENLDVDKAQLLVDQIAGYKHNKKKGELERRLKPLIGNNVCYVRSFGHRTKIIKGVKHGIHYLDEIAEWDKDDLIDFEAKVLKMEEVKVKVDEQEKKEKPIRNRKLEYKRIDDLLLEALVEKLEEGRPEKMVKYLELRKDIKNKHPLEE